MMQARNASDPEYYLTPDCPTEDGRIEARWTGTGSRILGLGDEFDQTSFLRLARGLNPHTGDKLTARVKKDRIDGTDVTMTVPKSVSVLIEVLGDDRAKDALWEANEFAMRLVEKKAQVRVRKGGVNEDRETGNMTIASFYHGTTRPIVEKRDPGHASFYSNGVEILVSSANDNQAKPDPHAHIHNYVMNVSLDVLDAKTPWKAVKRHRYDFPEIERKFHDRLAKNLKRLGYGIEKTGKTFEVKGIGEEIQSLYSRRQGEIKVEETARPHLNAGSETKTGARKLAAARAQLSQVVRQPKPEKPLSRSDVQRFWIGRLSGDQFGGLAGLREEAKSSLRRDRWREGLRRHVNHLRSFIRQMEPEHARAVGRDR